jgi:hypothetical protein
LYPVVGKATAGWGGAADPLYTGRDYHVAAIICENLAANQHEPVPKSINREAVSACVPRERVATHSDLHHPALVHSKGPEGMVGCPFPLLGRPMPHKHNADRRHHIPKMAFKVQNWPEYEAGLRRRGSLTLWIEDAALEGWQTCGPGGQARYSDAAVVQTSLMVRTAFKLPLRQAEGLLASVLALMDLPISAPDHTTVSRRAVKLPVIQSAPVPQGPLHVLIDGTGLQVYGAGQWVEAKQGTKSRRKWRKLHLAVDAASGMIVAQTLTDQDGDDPSRVAPLLDRIDGRIVRVTADGAYDGDPTYETIAAHGDGIEVVIPPRSTAVPSGELGSPTQRDRHLAMITEHGRLAWQVATNYGQRALIETTMGRYKALVGPRLRARGFAAQQTEAAIGVAVLNRMLTAGRPESVRCQRIVT